MLFVSTASPSIANKLGIDSDIFIKKHFIFSLISVLLISLISNLNTEQIKHLGVIGTGVCLILLVAVLLFGSSAKGAKRWLYLFNFSLQPSEILKPLFLTFNAYLLSIFPKKESLKKLLASSVVFFVIVALILLQPDIGMIILITMLFGIQLFMAELPMVYFLIMGFLGATSFALMYIFIPHVTNRINGFIASLISSKNINYQVSKSLKAYSRGGFLGKGPLEGTIKNSIPDAHTDFIFAVIGEEFGLFFCFIILCIFFYITLRTLLKIRREDDSFKFLTGLGLISQFILQTVINIGVTLNLLPTKGMTLPFLSYGGSSMLGMSICFGIILALTKKTYKTKMNLSTVILEKI